MPSKGDTVFINDDPSGTAPNWVRGTVEMTDTDPTPSQWAAAFAASGGYFPAQPAAGQILVAYYGQSGYNVPNTPCAAYATEGTGTLQYQTTNPG